MPLLLVKVENLVRKSNQPKHITHQQEYGAAACSPRTQKGRIEFNATLIEKIREAELNDDTIALVIEKDTTDGHYLDPSDSDYQEELTVASLKDTLLSLGIKIESKIYTPSEAQELTTSKDLSTLAQVEPRWQFFSHYSSTESLAHAYYKADILANCDTTNSLVYINLQEFKNFNANGTELNLNYLRSILKQEDFSPKKLVDALCKIPFLQYAFDLSAGLNPEKFSVRYHTEEVLRVMQEHKEQVEKRFTKFGMGMQSAALFFALHDIGKGIAKASLTNATKSDENRFTIAIVKAFCETADYWPSSTEVFIQLLENDFMGEYLTSRLEPEKAVEVAKAKIIKIRDEVNAKFRQGNSITVTAEDVYFLGKIYHQVDAGAYNNLRSDKTASQHGVIFSGQKNDTGPVKLQYNTEVKKKASLLHASLNEPLSIKLKELQETVRGYQDKIQSKQSWAGLRYFGDVILRVLAFPFVDLVRLINQGTHYKVKGRPTLIAKKLELIKCATASVETCITADKSARELALNLASLKTNLSSLDADNISASKQWLFTSVKKEAGGNLHQTLQAAQTTIDEIQTILKNRKPAPV